MTFDFPITEEFKRKVDNILDLGVGSLLPSLISQNGFIGVFLVSVVSSLLWLDYAILFMLSI